MNEPNKYGPYCGHEGRQCMRLMNGDEQCLRAGHCIGMVELGERLSKIIEEELEKTNPK